MTPTPSAAGPTSAGSHRVPRWLYFVIFTASGFAGLIYESIWSHYLKLFLGHAAYAQSLVLMIFMGGLAVGSWLAARWGVRLRLPVLGYALAELLIGAAAFVFHDTFVGLTDAFRHVVLPAIDVPWFAHTLKWTAAALLMVPQTILLGMTFPLLSAGILRRYPDRPGESLALLYFTNSIGGAIGVLASGFWLIASVGLPGTLQVAGLINVVLALAVVAMLAADRERVVAPRAAQTTGLRSVGGVFLLAAFITGLASFIYEIAWIRMLSLVLGATTHAFELMLSAFVMGLALGGLWIRRHVDNFRDPLAAAAVIQVLMGVVAALSIPIYAQSFDWMAALLGAMSLTDSGYRLFTLASHAIALSVMLPTTFLAGMTLPLFTNILLERGHGESAIGNVYAANTCGAIVGVLFAVHVGLPLLGVRNLVLSGALLDIGLGIALFYFLAARPGWRAVATPAGIGVGVLVVVLATVSLKPETLASGVFRYRRASISEGSDMLFYRDGKTASVAVWEEAPARGGHRVIATNGKPDASVQPYPNRPAAPDELTQVLVGALPLAFHDSPTHAAVIGFGSGTTSRVLLADERLEVLDTIEIEPVMIEGAGYLLPDTARTLADPRARTHIEDAKTFFPMNRRKYDIIVSEPSNPWVSGIAGLFTADFYAQITDHLEADGILVQWIQSYEFTDELYFSVVKALLPHFGDVVLFTAGAPSADSILIARKSAPLGAGNFDRMLATRVGAELRRAGLRTGGDLALRRVLGRRTLSELARSYAVPANSDYAPYVDINAPRARFAESAVSFIEAWLGAPLPALEMLAGAAPNVGEITLAFQFSRATGALAASVLHGRLVRGRPLPESVDLREPLRLALLAVAEAAGSCDAVASDPAYLLAAHEVLSASLPFLAAAQAGELAAAVFPAACDAGAAPPAAGWAALYRAVANRDGAAMAGAGRSVLRDASRLEKRRREYAAAAVLLGELARDRPDVALNAWGRYAEQRVVGPAWSPYVDQLRRVAAGRGRVSAAARSE